MKKIILFFSLIIPVFSQVSYEPIESPIYEFLDRQAAQGRIHLDDVIKPYSRKYVLNKLIELKNIEPNLSSLEKENLNFYYKGFYLERDDKLSELGGTSFSGFVSDAVDRYSLYTYKDDLFKFTVDPIAGMSLGKYDGASRIWYRGGLSFHGVYWGECWI